MIFGTSNDCSTICGSVRGFFQKSAPLPFEICYVMFKWVCAVLVALKDLSQRECVGVISACADEL